MSYIPAPAGTDPVAHWLQFNADRKQRLAAFEADWLANRMENTMKSYDPRFDSDRERRAKMQADYHAGLAEINAPDMAQLEQTRGPDPIGDDVRAVLGFLGLVAGVVGLVVWVGLS